MPVRELGTGKELLTIHRPYRCGASSCKCCCYQEATMSSGNSNLGTIQEDCWCCVPSFTVTTPRDGPLYKIHPPTCCGGVCVDGCTEGCPCGRGCCKAPFHVFPAHQRNTDMAPYVGKIIKRRKNVMAECCTQNHAFDVDLPINATAEQRGLLVGTAVLLNSVFFRGQDSPADA